MTCPITLLSKTWVMNNSDILRFDERLENWWPPRRPFVIQWLRAYGACASHDEWLMLNGVIVGCIGVFLPFRHFYILLRVSLMTLLCNYPEDQNQDQFPHLSDHNLLNPS